jgi:two-component system, chemotaxis family, chemotaxis protein CheY
MSILVVEDHSATARILEALLKKLGFSDIDDAADGPSALTRMGEKQYALVISDWSMEPMTGHELLKEIRADRNLKKIRFIMVSATWNAANTLAAKESGVNAYIVKPFDAETLKAKIDEAFAV